MRIFIVTLIIFSSLAVLAQKDSTEVRRLDFTSDFRFRIEHDWNSRKTDGTYREDRSRLRYRFRFGLTYLLDKRSSFGARIRSGNINDQQGPHLTIGGNNGEFGLAQIGFEKLYYQFQNKHLKAWIGKSSIPLRKTNELFWNDNVFPEGIGIQYSSPKLKHKLISQVSANVGHFVIQSRNTSFSNDAFLQIAQLDFDLCNGRINIYPGWYYFHQVGNFPDQKHEFLLDYKILHIGSEWLISKKDQLKLGVEIYRNFQEYLSQQEIAENFKDKKDGLVLSIKYGQLKQKGDFNIALFLAHLERYAIVDYFAQNDWARWDYSSIDASGSRLSNFRGLELQVGYAFRQKFNLILRAYQVDQLISSGLFNENGSRIRLDLNIGF